MSLTNEWITVLLAVLGGAFYIERRLSRVETLMTNHLAHHDEFRKIVMKILEIKDDE